MLVGQKKKSVSYICGWTRAGKRERETEKEHSHPRAEPDMHSLVSPDRAYTVRNIIIRIIAVFIKNQPRVCA